MLFRVVMFFSVHVYKMILKFVSKSENWHDTPYFQTMKFKKGSYHCDVKDSGAWVRVWSGNLLLGLNSDKPGHI